MCAILEGGASSHKLSYNWAKSSRQIFFKKLNFIVDLLQFKYLVKTRFMKNDIKETIINSFQNPETHPTADELYQALQAKLGEVNKEAFLDELKGLLKTKEVYYVLVPEGTKHYGLKKGAHCHFICEGCGKIKDFRLEEGAQSMLDSYIQKKTHS